MSHTNQTPNYHLPQFIGTDKPAWLVDFNQAMSDIDTQMKANETASGTAEADAQSALSGVTALNSQVGGIQTSVTALETQAPLDEAQIETNRQNIATNAQNIVDLDNRMGHTSISGIGDGSATGAIKAVDDKVGDLADLDTTDKTSVVNAINELAQGGGLDPSTVRYDEQSKYIQCKDSQGWFNWRKAFRSIFNAITNNYNQTPVGSGVTYTTDGTTGSLIVSNSSGSLIYFDERTSETGTIHVKGTLNTCSNGRFRIVYSASNDGLNNTTVVETSTTGAFNTTLTVPAGMYIGIGMASDGSGACNASLEDFYID